MNNEPVNISTLISAVKTPTVVKAPLHADRPIAIGEDFAAFVSEERTAQTPAVTERVLGARCCDLVARPGRVRFRGSVEAEVIRAQVGQRKVGQHELGAAKGDMDVGADLLGR